MRMAKIQIYACALAQADQGISYSFILSAVFLDFWVSNAGSGEMARMRKLTGPPSPAYSLRAVLLHFTLCEKKKKKHSPTPV